VAAGSILGKRNSGTNAITASGVLIESIAAGFGQFHEIRTVKFRSLRSTGKRHRQRSDSHYGQHQFLGSHWSTS
jgi:hypothetical protein